jgi:hypothetical protein
MDFSTLANLPTDSLYKFIALSGIVLLIVSVSVPAFLKRTLYERQFKLRRSAAKEKVQVKFLKLKLAYHKDLFRSAKERNEQTTAGFPSLLERIRALDQAAHASHSDFSFRRSEQDIELESEEVLSKLEELENGQKEHSKELDDIEDQFKSLQYERMEREIALAELECDLERVELIAADIVGITRLQILGVLLALSLSVTGFSLWYVKLQVHLDQFTALEAQRMKSVTTSEKTLPSGEVVPPDIQ